MNTKIKIFIVGTIALWGLFNSFNNNVSAQTVVAHCDSATLTGTVYPNGSPTEAWFDWGPTIPPAYHTARRTFYSTSSYSDIITGLTPSTRYFYRAMAQNAGGLATGDTKDFYTPACPVPNPTVNIYANPSSIQYGGNSTLSWSSINATSCSAVWTTSTAISGSKVVFPTSTSAYSIICTGPGGDASDSVSVTVSDPPQTPTVTISANPISVSYNGSSILTWSSTDSTSCSATDAWSGTKATSGSQSTGNLTSSKTYTLTCAGAGGNATDSVTVIVYPILQPSVNLEANPINIKSGEISTLFWNSSNAISCSASWTTSTATSGSKTIYPTSTTTYSITCNGASGSTPASDSVTVKVEPQILKPPPPTGLTATAVSQTQINLSWNASSGATSYDVYRIESDHALSYIGSSSVPSYSSTGLSCGYVDPYTGTGYRFVVTASNAGGTSDLSNMAIATTDACTPGAVTIGSASPTSQTAMNVTWTRNSPFTETGFKIYQYQPELNPLRGTAGTGATSGSATSLACGTPYRFYVQSYVTTNGRTYTAPGISGITKEATTDPCTPAPPTGVTATPMNQQQIWVNWNSVPGASGYAIFVCSATPAYPGCTPDLWLVWQSNIGKSVVPYSASGCGGFGGYRVKTSVDGGGGRRYYSNFSSAAYATADLCTSAPTVNLSADDTNIDYNASTYIRWNSTNTTSCSASGGNSGWAGSKSFSGSFYTGALSSTKTYNITCINNTGSANDSVTVNVGSQVLNPTVNLSADDTNVAYNASTYIRWNSTNATSCSASGGSSGWAGNKSLSGSFYTGALSSSKTYTLTCVNNSGSATDTVTVNVGSQVLNPTVNLSADDTNVAYNASTYIRWSSTNATSCSASGGSSGWAGNKSLSGSFYTGALSSSKTYTLTCVNNSGSATDTVTVNVGSQVLNPTVNISADDPNVAYNASTYIRWSSTNATSCSASGGSNGWAGNKSFSGSFYTGSLYDNVTYTIRCSNDTGSADDSITIVVNENEEELNPTVDITASDQDLNYGDSTYIRWTSNNATSCSATGGTNSWSGTKSTSGSFYTGALYDTEIYTIRCSNSSASASDSVTIYVEDEDDEQPTVNTRAATNIDEESATLNGFVDSNGGSNVEAWFEWGTDNDYDNHTSHINYGHTSGTDFDYDLDGLDSDETYYFRAVAQNDSGERVFGSQKSFRTDEDGNNNDNEEGPNVTTYSATDVQNDSAILNGYVDTNGTSTRRWFEWGTSRSSLSHETDKSSKSTSSRNFEQSIDNLNPDTTYYFRAVAENNNDIDYGNILSFRTESDYEDNACDYGTCTPTAVTIMVSNVGQSSARLNGLGLVNNNVYTTGYFEYGTTQALGSVTINKNIGSTQSNPFYESLFNLVSGRIYYYQAVVINQYGTSRGDIVSFRTTSPTVYIDTNTNTNTVYRNTTVVTNTNNTAGTSRPSLVLLNVSRDGETIRRGDIIEYVVNYKNVSSKNLRDVVLRISIPKELEFMEASRGYFSTENSTVVANIGNLDSQEEGSVNVRVQVTTDTEVGKIVVVTANLAYTIIDNSAQEEVFAYSKNTIGDREVVQQGALAFLFGDGFLPNTLLGWLLIILLIVLLILAVRKAYYESKTLAVSDASKKHS